MSSNCSTPSATFFRHRSISPESKEEEEEKNGKLKKISEGNLQEKEKKKNHF